MLLVLWACCKLVIYSGEFPYYYYFIMALVLLILQVNIYLFNYYCYFYSIIFMLDIYNYVPEQTMLPVYTVLQLFCG